MGHVHLTVQLNEPDPFLAELASAKIMENVVEIKSGGDDELLPDREIVFTDLLKFPKMLLWSFIALAGMAMTMVPILSLGRVKEIAIWTVIKPLLLPTAGVLVFLIASSFLRAEISKRRGLRPDRFVDVDARSRQEELDGLRTEIRHLRIQAKSGRPEVNGGGIKDIDLSSFHGYFDSIRQVLEDKAANSDHKASILLDKGVAYSRLGIIFFVASIIAWQLVAWEGGLKQQHIYGVVSCSLLFVFIEFLSAWFLRQYRHFVDTSTYLMKVKSIFDRYMLSYLAAREFGSLEIDEPENRHSTAVLDILRDDIKWPDSHVVQAGDVSFAREAVDALANVAKAREKARGGKAGRGD